MAHTFDTSLYTTTNPFNYTCGTGTTLFVLGIYSYNGARTGNDPTFGGIPMQRASNAAFDYGEGSGELWYITNPSTGSEYSVLIGNGTNQNLALRGSSYRAQDGSTSVCDVSVWRNTTGTNPTQDIVQTNNGVLVQMCAHEASGLPTAYTDKPIRPVDHGAHNSWMQYRLVTSSGSTSIGATQARDEYVLITVAFKEGEVAAPTGQKIYAWSGSAWAQGVAKVWTGSWTLASVKRYSGSSWVPL